MANSIEKLAAKGKGMVNRANARVHGLQGIFLTLCKEHGEAGALLQRLAKTEDISKRKALFPELRMKLLTHERGEMELLYSRLQTMSGAQSLVLNHNREAEDMERVINLLSSEPYTSREWSILVERLAGLVEADDPSDPRESLACHAAAWSLLGRDVHRTGPSRGL